MRALIHSCWLFLLVGMTAYGAEQNSTERFKLSAPSTLKPLLLSALDLNVIAAEDVERDLRGEPPRYAIPKMVDIVPEQSGEWSQVPGGPLVWRYRVKADDATSLNLGFSEFRLPEGASLFVYGIEQRYQIRPFTALDNEDHGQLWTPVLPLNDLVIELTLPSTARKDYRLRLSQIGHGYRGFGSRPITGSKTAASSCSSPAVEPADFGQPDVIKTALGVVDVTGNKSAEKSGSCNMDTACIGVQHENAEDFMPWKETAKASGVISTGGSTFCSGSLINNSANDRKMYFVTAAHCSINAGNAASLVVHWNYENPTCRVPGSAASGAGPAALPSTFNTGAIHRVTNSQSDFTLVELDDPLQPTQTYLHWAGWDRTPYGTGGGIGNGDFDCTNGAHCACIHHPAGDEKRITFVELPTTTTSYNNPAVPGDSTHVRARWSASPPIFDIAAGGNTGTSGNPPGVTEPGSSGSPLYNAQRRFIGQLHGGPSACGATGDNLSDYYGRFSLSFLASNTASYLDPTNSAAMAIDGIGTCNAPAVPLALSAVSNGDNRIDLSWSASAGAETYNVFRAVGSCGGAGYVLLAANVAGTTYSDTTVSGGTTYSYKVTSYDEGEQCESVQSACDDAAAVGQCTLAPTFAGASSVQSTVASTCGLVVNWSAATGNCAAPSLVYNVYRGSTSNFVPSAGNRIASCQTAATITDSSVDYGTTYYYIVRAEDTAAAGSGPCGGSEDSNMVARSATPTGLITSSNVTDTFEGAQSGGGFDLQGWSKQVLSGTNAWTWSTAQNQTPTHSWFSPSQASASARALISPSFGVLSNSTLSFFHTYDFEFGNSNCYDSGTLEISTNGGTSWSVMPDAAFTAGVFNGTSATGTNPNSGKRAWCDGAVGPMTQVSVNLGAFSGQTANLRWTAGDDVSIANTGWFVDSVTINNVGTAGVCSNVPIEVLYADGFE